MSKQTNNKIDLVGMDIETEIYDRLNAMDAISAGETRTRATRWHNHVSIHDFNRVRAFLNTASEAVYNSNTIPVKRYRILSSEIPSLPKMLGPKLTKAFDACSVAE